jgi:glyoxylase-like metal-dependent hydrolase (beta-lactamase superfamily II)
VRDGADLKNQGAIMEIVKINTRITALVTPLPIPGLGVLPINAFVLDGPSPILVDSCVTKAPAEFVSAVAGIIDPADIKWIWLTHADRDHTGGLQEMLAAAPNATVVTNFISAGHLSTGPEPLPMDRVYFVNSGDRFDAGDRELIALRPPLFDNPGTVGFFDTKDGTLVSSDFLGAPMPTMEDAMVSDIAAVDDDVVKAGQLVWGSGDSPWVHSVDESKFAAALDSVRKLDPQIVLSTHLPAIHGELEGHLETMRTLPGSPMFVGPNQAALEAMLAEMEPAQA